MFWPYALTANRGIAYVMYFVFTEVTNPLLNLRWLLENRIGWENTKLYEITLNLIYLKFYNDLLNLRRNLAFTSSE